MTRKAFPSHQLLLHCTLACSGLRFWALQVQDAELCDVPRPAGHSSLHGPGAGCQPKPGTSCFFACPPPSATWILPCLLLCCVSKEQALPCADLNELSCLTHVQSSGLVRTDFIGLRIEKQLQFCRMQIQQSQVLSQQRLLGPLGALGAMLCPWGSSGRCQQEQRMKSMLGEAACAGLSCR